METIRKKIEVKRRENAGRGVVATTHLNASLRHRHWQECIPIFSYLPLLYFAFLLVLLILFVVGVAFSNIVFSICDHVCGLRVSQQIIESAI